MVLEVKDKGIHATSVLSLAPFGDRSTRMILRLRARFRPKWIAYFLIFDPGDFVMMRKMMLGIKQRAERRAAAQAIVVPVRDLSQTVVERQEYCRGM